MVVLARILTTFGVLTALIFTLLVFFTGKGDAMSGSGGVRTTFKGKASFDDTMARMTLGFGIAFMALMLIINVVESALLRNKP
ncbi:MAG: preprotein translocase subunit SecG [Fimbriimonas ginsengisoli]|uniref:Protein-export membrane protein SecG n=1 Tax=Fimbriimonas ginsengisoli TaxID=1005039 RepID=A0A931PTG0_FIMGI|nr:preprotein translocase subunit SecG [Fimbriimonas ginsengisoli]MBI3721835.1 preprotein translocase subunit SecG [Fimbriimonas ginsengisoli]